MKHLNIEENINLANLTTMKLGGPARYFVRLSSENQIPEIIEFVRSKDLPIYILGDGSNTIVNDQGFAGLVIKNELMGREIVREDEDSIEFSLGAGENWDSFVQYSVLEKNLTGAEAMVMIPGTVGALPVQNVGAYGQEVSDIFVNLRAYDIETNKFVSLLPQDCQFSYRDSIFRRQSAGRYLITQVNLRLFKSSPNGPYYSGVESYFAKKGLSMENVTAKQIMQAVQEIRQGKLPDPKQIPSTGSFFKNAVISSAKAEQMKQDFGENIPLFPLKNGDFKVATGWLIDQVGLKGKTINGMRPHPGNALVLTNISAKSYTDLAQARELIQQKVFEKFAIKIEQEPLEI